MTTIARTTSPRAGSMPAQLRVGLKLYIAGVAPSSRRAEANLASALDELSLSSSAFSLELIDVLADAQRVMRDNIIVTPTLTGTSPLHRLVMVGDLSDTAKLRDFLATLFERR